MNWNKVRNWVLVALVVLMLIVVAVADAVADRFLVDIIEDELQSVRTTPGACLAGTPEDYGITNYDLVELDTEDGLVLKGSIYIQAKADQPKGNMGVMHGAAGEDGAMFFMAMAPALVEDGWNVLFINGRNYCGNLGETTFGFEASKDVEAGIAWLQNKSPGLPTIAVGLSQGGAATLFALADPEYDGVAGFVINPFTRFETNISWSISQEYTGGLLPPKLLHTYVAQAMPRVWPDWEARESMSVAHKIVHPVLIFGGGSDQMIDPQEYKRLHELMPNSKLEMNDGMRHNPMEDERIMWQVVESLLAFANAQLVN